MKVEKDQHISDNELLQNFYLDHDNHWLGVLLQRYTMLLLGVCVKYLRNEEEAKDCVQQIFLKTITELHKYKVDYFKSWIYMVARNHCLMKLRDKTGRMMAEIKDDFAGPGMEANLEDRAAHIEKDLRLETMELALNELNEAQKRCVILFYLDKKSYQSIAEITGYSILNIKSHIQNGKRNLKLAMEKKLK
ncbi:MAG: sigma-70 family RNA polymerase sigma factor [Chitinophagaceae bacterium]